jgi:hypothetical protein
VIETLLKLYVAAMSGDVRSPTPHFVGPPGCGKSVSMKLLAEMVGKKLHTINVSRINPLELEGLMMPVEDNTSLRMLHSTIWADLREGDILFFDEFLRGFPEVYNGLLDIFTAREVKGLELPKVFIVAASNSVVTYDPALEDRLQHILVPDPRRSKTAKAKLAEIIVDELGLLPAMATSYEMQTLLDQEVLPMYEILDSFKPGSRNQTPGPMKGTSVRKLIGQAHLRHVECPALHELLTANNRNAINAGKEQYVLLPDGKTVTATYPRYFAAASQLVGNPKLSPIQARNISLNLQLIEMEQARSTNEEDEDDILSNEPPF